MDYNSLLKELSSFKNLKIKIIGRSWDNRNIISVSTFFYGKPFVLIHGGIHAREHLTVELCLCLAKKIDENYSFYEKLENFPNICFIPLVNPDGVDFSIFGIDCVNSVKYKKLLSKITQGKDYRLFKSNIRGVDINNNFDAKFDSHLGVNFPSFQGYKGGKPFSEKESQTLRNITLKIKPIFTISYHMKGEEIYYDFYQEPKQRKRDEQIAKLIARITGYTIKSTEKFSFGGYKDWCISCLKIPSVTIEVGRDKILHPVPFDEINDIIFKNTGIIDILCDIVNICKEKI